MQESRVKQRVVMQKAVQEEGDKAAVQKHAIEVKQNQQVCAVLAMFALARTQEAAVCTR